MSLNLNIIGLSSFKFRIHGIKIMIFAVRHTERADRIPDRDVVLFAASDSIEAAAVVRACRYPPQGVRGQGALVARATGFNAIADYTTNANDEICILVQAESRAALDDLDRIAAVNGVDGIFIGPADLAADMGHRDDPSHPDVQAAIADAIPRIRAAGKAAGIILGTPEARVAAVAQGANFLGMGSEATLLADALRTLAAE